MSMNGNYSFADYESMLNQQKATVDQLLSTFKQTIAEYRNLIDTTDGKLAREYLNLMYDSDTNTGLGDLFASASVTDEQLKTIFLQGNTKFLTAIETVMSLACRKDINGTTLLDRIKTVSIDDVYDSDSLYTADTIILDEFDKIIEKIEMFEEFRDDAAEYYISEGEITSEDELTDELINGYFDLVSGSISSSKQYGIASGWTILKVSSEITYFDTEYTLYDVICMAEEMHDDAELLCYMVDPLATVMTSGQFGALSAVGLDTVIYQAQLTDEQAKAELDDAKAELAELGITGQISVYTGVDRTIYTADGIALTTEANNETYANENYEWVLGDEAEKRIADAKIAQKVGQIFIVTAAPVVLFVTILTAMIVPDLEAFTEAMQTYFTFSYFGGEGLFPKTFSIVTNGVFWGALLAAGILITIGAFLFRYFYEKSQRKYVFKEYTYTDIPRIIVDYVEPTDSEDGFYAYYYNVKTIDGELGDLNGWDNKTNKYWNALYYTKDTRVGTPLTEKLLISNSADAPSGTVGVHDFAKGVEGVKSAVNLNVSSKAQDTPIYLYMTHYTSNTKTGSVFTSAGYYGNFVVVAITAAAISGCGVYIYTAKKRKNESETEA